MNLCANPSCNMSTNNPKYCSKKCSVQTNNRLFPKRIKQIVTTQNCWRCGSPTIYVTKRKRLCSSCKKINLDMTFPLVDTTINDYIGTSVSYIGPNRFVKIRSQARAVARRLGRVFCERANCGYRLHVEVAHIKPISKFTLDTMLSVVNSPNQIVVLCPNCHWEFDHGIISMKDLVLPPGNDPGLSVYKTDVQAFTPWKRKIKNIRTSC